MTDAAHGGSERLVADALPRHRALALIDAANGGNPVTEMTGDVFAACCRRGLPATMCRSATGRSCASCGSPTA